MANITLLVRKYQYVLVLYSAYEARDAYKPAIDHRRTFNNASLTSSRPPLPLGFRHLLPGRRAELPALERTRKTSTTTASKLLYILRRPTTFLGCGPSKDWTWAMCSSIFFFCASKPSRAAVSNSCDIAGGLGIAPIIPHYAKAAFVARLLLNGGSCAPEYSRE